MKKNKMEEQNVEQDEEQNVEHEEEQNIEQHYEEEVEPEIEQEAYQEQENINEIGEENLCEECNAEQGINDGNEEQKITTTEQIFIPENNQTENEN